MVILPLYVVLKNIHELMVVNRDAISDFTLEIELVFPYGTEHEDYTEKIIKETYIAVCITANTVYCKIEIFTKSCISKMVCST